MLLKITRFFRHKLSSDYIVFGLAILTVIIYALLLLAPFRTGHQFYWLYVDCSDCVSDGIVDFAPLIVLIMLSLWII